MKRSEGYIEKLSKQFRISIHTAKTIYEAINKYNWDVFNSQMGDYDHPGERVAAAKKLESFKGMYSSNFKKVIDNIQDFMKEDEEYNIHKMDEEA